MIYVKPNILFVDDDENVLNGLRRSLYTCTTQWNMFFESNPLKALKQLQNKPFDILISDLDMPHMDGLMLIKKAKEIHPHCEAILLTGKGDFKTALHAINQAEVYRFFTKPCDIDDLVFSFEEILDKKKQKNLTNTLPSSVQPSSLQKAVFFKRLTGVERMSFTRSACPLTPVFE